MNDPIVLIDPIIEETRRALVSLKRTKDLNKRKIQSEIVYNLCRSLGVFFDLISEVMRPENIPGFFDEYQDDDEE